MSKHQRLNKPSESPAELLKSHIQDVIKLWSLDAESAIEHWKETRDRLSVAKLAVGHQVFRADA